MKSLKEKVGFSLHGMKTEQFAVFEKNYNPKKETLINTQLQFKLNHLNRLIAVFIHFELLHNDKVFVKLVVSCQFRIKDTSWDSFANNETSKLIVPKGFMSHLAMITVGTARGILFAKTEGTQFSKFILPLMNVADIIEKDIEFDLKHE